MKSNNEKVQEKFPDFTVEVQRLSSDALKARIVSLQQQLEASEECKANDEQLKDARAALDLYSGPYRDVKQAVKMKTKYLVDLLKERGE